jgi:hypothetical protein
MNMDPEPVWWVLALDYFLLRETGSICRDISAILKFNLVPVFLSKILTLIPRKSCAYQARSQIEPEDWSFFLCTLALGRYAYFLLETNHKFLVTKTETVFNFNIDLISLRIVQLMVFILICYLTNYLLFLVRFNSRNNCQYIDLQSFIVNSFHISPTFSNLDV